MTTRSLPWLPPSLSLASRNFFSFFFNWNAEKVSSHPVLYCRCNHCYYSSSILPVASNICPALQVHIAYRSSNFLAAAQISHCS